jgi:REP element-mobilizing transposase RayT
MSGTFSQLYIHYVFAVRGRQNILYPPYDEEVYRYIAGIIREKGQKPLAINGMPDHTHVLVGLKPAMRIADLIRDIKNNSTNFINEKGWFKNKFSWQEGYGVFSYSHSAFGNVINYIKNQKEHHRQKNFRDEYLELLRKFDIQYEEKYLFEFYD